MIEEHLQQMIDLLTNTPDHDYVNTLSQVFVRYKMSADILQSVFLHLVSPSPFNTCLIHVHLIIIAP